MAKKRKTRKQGGGGDDDGEDGGKKKGKKKGFHEWSGAQPAGEIVDTLIRGLSFLDGQKLSEAQRKQLAGVVESGRAAGAWTNDRRASHLLRAVGFLHHTIGARARVGYAFALANLTMLEGARNMQALRDGFDALLRKGWVRVEALGNGRDPHDPPPPNLLMECFFELTPEGLQAAEGLK